MTDKVTVYIALLDEGTNCWVPVYASPQGDGSFVIHGDMPDDERWQFRPGSRVLCEPRTFSQGEVGLVAVKLV
jgi:hypothetical protein